MMPGRSGVATEGTLPDRYREVIDEAKHRVEGVTDFRPTTERINLKGFQSPRSPTQTERSHEMHSQ